MFFKQFFVLRDWGVFGALWKVHRIANLSIDRLIYQILSLDISRNLSNFLLPTLADRSSPSRGVTPTALSGCISTSKRSKSVLKRDAFAGAARESKGTGATACSCDAPQMLASREQLPTQKTFACIPLSLPLVGLQAPQPLLCNERGPGALFGSFLEIFASLAQRLSPL